MYLPEYNLWFALLLKEAPLCQTEMYCFGWVHWVSFHIKTYILQEILSHLSLSSIVSHLTSPMAPLDAFMLRENTINKSQCNNLLHVMYSNICRTYVYKMWEILYKEPGRLSGTWWSTCRILGTPGFHSRSDNLPSVITFSLPCFRSVSYQVKAKGQKKCTNKLPIEQCFCAWLTAQ